MYYHILLQTYTCNTLNFTEVFVGFHHDPNICVERKNTLLKPLFADLNNRFFNINKTSHIYYLRRRIQGWQFFTALIMTSYEKILQVYILLRTLVNQGYIVCKVFSLIKKKENAIINSLAAYYIISTCLKYHKQEIIVQKNL